MFLSVLTSLLTGGIADAVTAVKEVKLEKLRLENTVLSLGQELELKRMEQEVSARKAMTRVRLATADHWEMRLAVATVVLPTALHYGFTVIDMIYGFGWDIQPLPEPFNSYQREIILGFFGLTFAKQGVNALAAKLMREK